MDLLLNDLSFHGQFQDIAEFKGAIGRVMALREVARRFGRDIHCNRSMLNARATHNQTVPQVVQAIGVNEARALMQWFSRSGPFWDDARVHSGDDYLDYNGDVVTDTALGEAAFGCIHGADRGLASLTPSAFNDSPLPVSLIPSSGDPIVVGVENHWRADTLESALARAPAPINSWDQLEVVCRGRFTDLTFSDSCFISLRGHPFVDGAARQTIAELDVLNRIAKCFDENGQRTAEGQRLYQDHFTGKKAWFTDSTDGEKNEFKKELTFKHPGDDSVELFCPWHGKVKWPQIRIHFSWPIRANEPVYVVYVGPKLTKR